MKQTKVEERLNRWIKYQYGSSGWEMKLLNFINAELLLQKKETLEEVKSIFRKYKNEPMTGNVVLLELSALEKEEI